MGFNALINVGATAIPYEVAKALKEQAKSGFTISFSTFPVF